MGKYNNTKSMPIAPLTNTELPPHDEQVERFVLGFIMSYPSNYEGYVRETLDEDCFYEQKHKEVYRVIEQTAASGVLPDLMAVVTTAARTIQDNQMFGYEAATMASEHIGSNIEYSVKVLVELRTKRQMQTFYQKIQNKTLENPDDAWTELQGIIKANNSAKESEFSELLRLPTKESLDEKFQQTQDAYETKYIFKKGQIEYPLMIPSGAITFIAAPTSHGKSTLLRCLALDMAKEEHAKKPDDRGAILYFSFEEDDTDVIAQVMNTYIGMDFTRANKDFSHGNLSSLKEFLRSGNGQYIKHDLQNNVAMKADEFRYYLLYTGILRFFYRNYDSAKLIKAIEYIQRKVKVKAVFIDYIQLLQMEGKSGKVSRTEELKAICSDLKDFAVTSKLPIICAAQLNREGAKSPLDMRPQNMSESSDIEKIANVIVCMYNSDHKPDNSSDYEKRSKENETITRNGFVIGSNPTKIYAVIAKNRGGIIGGDAVFEFNGNTGEIKHNAEGNNPTIQDKKPSNMALASFGKKQEQPKESELPFEAPTDNSSNNF